MCCLILFWRPVSVMSSGLRWVGEQFCKQQRVSVQCPALGRVTRCCVETFFIHNTFKLFIPRNLMFLLFRIAPVSDPTQIHSRFRLYSSVKVNIIL